MTTQIKVLVGPPHSGISARLLAIYQQSLAAGEPASLALDSLWIGPNAYGVGRLRDRLMAHGQTAYFNPELYTFSGFAESILLTASELLRPISQLQKHRLLKRVIQQFLQRKEIDYFAPVAKTSGFLLLVSELVSELKRRDIWAETFVRQAGSRRDRELAGIYREYQRQLAVGDLYDAEGRFWAARAELKNPTSQSGQRWKLVVVDGFSDFTAAQFEILQLLATRADQMLLSLSLDPACLESAPSSRKTLFAKPLRTLRTLQRGAAKVVVETVPWEPTHDAGGTTGLSTVAERLFDDRPDYFAPLLPSQCAGTAHRDEQVPAESPSDIEIIAAPSNQGEIEEIARRIKRLLVAGEVRPGEVLVVFRSLEHSAARVQAVFDDFGIPYACQWQARCSSGPLVRLVMALLRLHAQDWPYRSLLEVVGNNAVRVFDADSVTDLRTAIEQVIRDAQLPAGRDALLEQASRRAAANDQVSAGSDLAESDPASETLQWLATQLDALPVEAPIDRWIGALEELLQSLQVLPKPGLVDCWEGGVDLLREWQLLADGLHCSSLVDRWTQMEQHQLKIAEIEELISEVAHAQRLPSQGDRVGRVQILSIETARSATARQVFLAGLDEKSFPKSSSENRIYSQQDFSRLEQDSAGGTCRDSGPPDLQETDLSESDAHASDEILLFYELVTRATEKLTLSYSALDEKGLTLPPSRYLTELQRCFGETPLAWTKMPLTEVVPPRAVPLGQSETRRIAVAEALQGDQTTLAQLSSDTRYAATGQAILSGIQSISSRGVRDQFGRHEGMLHSQAAQNVLSQRYDAAHLWSPSQLESYAACPFRFYAQQVLGLEPLPELALRSDPRRRGTLLHQALAMLHEKLHDASQAAEQISDDQLPENEALLIERFRQALNQCVDNRPLGGIDRPLREIERREIEAWAPQYAQQHSAYQARWSDLTEPFQPSYFEVRFGPGSRASQTDADLKLSTDEPYRFQLGNEQILITGQIDRIDAGRVGNKLVLNIIDYKSGKGVRFTGEQMLAGTQLQLPLYALAAEEHLLSDLDAETLAAGYWNVKDKGFGSGKGKGTLEMREIDAGRLHPSAEWEELRGQLVERIEQLIFGIRQGQFPVFNRDLHCTRWCPYRTTCRVAHVRSLEKTWPPETDAGDV